MNLGHKALRSLSMADLMSLKDREIREGKDIEYKREMIEKNKFLASICSFANASGGELLFGIQEGAGLPVAFPGLSLADPDHEITRLESIVRDGIEPRIPNVELHYIISDPHKGFIIVRVHRSWALPHRVRETRRFYGRHSTGKYELDIGQIRAAFALSQSTIDHLRDFRVSRLAQIVARETPVPVSDSAKQILHIIPLNAFDPAIQHDSQKLAGCVPGSVSWMGWRRQPNFNGFLLSEHDGNVAMSYLQLFRNGAVEYVTDEPFAVRDGHKLISPRELERGLLSRFSEILSILRCLEVPPPVVVMLSLVEIAGYTMQIGGMHAWFRQSKPIPENVLPIPDLLLEDYECDLPRVFKPAFDTVWNAAGMPHSIYYDEHGNWTMPAR